MCSTSIYVLFVWFILFAGDVYCKSKENDIQLLKCPLEVQNITLVDTYSLKNFRYALTCAIDFFIPRDSYFYVTYQRSCHDPMSSQITFYTLQGAIGSFDGTGTIQEYMFEPPHIGVTIFSETIPECFYINFTIEKRKMSPFEKKKRISLNLSNEPYFIDLEILEVGYTYIYENESPIRLYRLLCDNYQLLLPDYTNVFLYNGTEEDSTLLGTFASRSSIFDPYTCEQGMLLNNFSLLVLGPVMSPEPESPNVLGFHFSTTKIMLLDNALIHGFSTIHAHVANFWEVSVDMNLYWELNDSQGPLAVLLLSEEYPAGVYPEFELVGKADIPIDWRFPNIEVYAGCFNFSQENLIVTYSEENYNSTLPQKFGGKIRTLRVRGNETAQITFGDSTMGDWEDYRDEDGYIFYPGSARKIFQPVVEPESALHLYYTFTFRIPCDGAELLLTTIVVQQRENFTYTCADGSVTLASRGIRAELFGDAIVDYRMSDRENSAQQSTIHLFLFLVLFICYG